MWLFDKNKKTEEKELLDSQNITFGLTDYRKCLCSVLEEYGFKHLNNRMEIHNNDLVIVVELQKSSFSDGFYTNCGFYIPSVHTEPADLKAVKDCDVDIRFEHENGIEEDRTLFDIKTTGLDAFSQIVRKHMDEIVIPVMDKGIQALYEIEPDVIYATKKELRAYIEIGKL